MKVTCTCGSDKFYKQEYQYGWVQHIVKADGEILDSNFDNIFKRKTRTYYCYGCGKRIILPKCLTTKEIQFKYTVIRGTSNGKKQCLLIKDKETGDEYLTHLLDTDVYTVPTSVAMIRDEWQSARA